MPASKNRDYPLTRELLQQYRDAALANAQELLDEATLLLQHEHRARAYFLAVASIEEVGKAVQAFDGMGRNLKDCAVSTRLKVQFDDHEQKISSAFQPWLQGSSNLPEELDKIINLILNVQHGREPAMYTDIHIDGPSVMTPSTSIRPITAESCVRLARDVLSRARPYVTQTDPQVKTRVQDAFLAMTTVWRKMAPTKDFWEYYMSRAQAGDMAIETAAIQYNKDYFSKGLPFKAESHSA
ncbi:MAG TPA: AbiV family abortive infection protein [Candidatus Tectomicrobia bacterium]